MPKYLLLLLTLFAFSCTPTEKNPDTDNTPPPNKFADSTLQVIYTAQDERKTEALLPWLKHENPVYREAAASAFGSVQDTLAVPELLPLLLDSVDNVAMAAAWALGQTGDSSAATPLLEAIEGRGYGIPTDAFLEAVGKCGGKTHLPPLLAIYDAPEADATFLDPILMGVYQFGLRGIISEDARDIAYETLMYADDFGKIYASAYLSRIRALGPVKNAERLRIAFERCDNPEPRNHLVRTFARCDDPSCLALLQRTIAYDQEDYRVRVNAIRACAGKMNPDLDSIMQLAARDKNLHVAIEAARFLRDHGDAENYNLYFTIAGQTQHWRAAAFMMAAGMRYALNQGDETALNVYNTSLKATLQQSSNPYEKGHLLLALSELPENNEFLIEQIMRKERVVSTYAMDGITNSYRQNPEQKADDKLANLVKIMEVDDVAIMAQAAALLREIEIPDRMQPVDVKFLESALTRLKLPEDIETYNEIEKAIHKLKSEEGDPELTKAPFNNPIDWKLVKSIPKDQTVIMQTSKGDVTMKLLIEDAPGSASNFVKLVQNNFYEKAVFHRVVPNFVAQGGCPRGDGWGSVPETIRSEWPELHYETGKVGMASAGKRY